MQGTLLVFLFLILLATPATWSMMVDSNWAGNKSMTILCGGDQLSSSLAQKLLPLCRDLFNMYGPTETTIWSAMGLLKTSQVTLGEPLHNTQIYVLDPYLNEVPIGCLGEIVIGGDGVTMGYLNDETKTKEKFLENSQFPSRVYKTGDVGKRLPNGEIM
jgi:non-ribosomal peptide synthetase component F